MGNQLETLDQVKAAVLDMAVRFGPRVLVAILILVVGYIVSRWAGSMLGRMLSK